jgi:hypothetical protein
MMTGTSRVVADALDQGQATRKDERSTTSVSRMSSTALRDARLVDEQDAVGG